MYRCNARTRGRTTTPATRRGTARLFLAATLGLAGCQEELDGPAAAVGEATGAIVNGDLETGHAAVGALTAWYGAQYAGSFCTATLIAADWVLTAAHCLDNVYPVQARFFVGNDATDPNSGTFYRALEFKVHEGYYRPTLRDDIALVRLQSPVVGVSRIPYAVDSLVPWQGAEALFIGFGATEGISETGAGIKRSTYLPITTVGSLTFQSTFTDTGTCFGDSGGPALLTIAQTTSVVGITSAGSTCQGANCDPCRTPTTSTRVDAYADWIAGKLAEPPPACPANTLCRPEAGPCDVAEWCDSAGTCPADAFKPAGMVCGDAASICDLQDTCDEFGVCVARVATTAIVCRSDRGECDVAERCDGAGLCPPDAFEAAETPCGGAGDGVCDLQDTCNGTGACVDHVASWSTVCREDTGACDVLERCQGQKTCPADTFEPAGTPCGGPGDGMCDLQDSCDSAGVCVDRVTTAPIVCRADAGACDIAERCDAAGRCPTDAFEPAGTSCGNAAAGSCDIADSCDGGGACIDRVMTTEVVCREDAGECDVAERCDGAGHCPPDTFEPEAAPCGGLGDGLCDLEDSCDGSGTCLDRKATTAIVCREGAGECDLAEHCDGDGRCPNETFELPATPCGSRVEDACTAPDSCDGLGTCQPNDDTTDSDHDGAFDCVDECPADGAKTIAGLCGCGEEDLEGAGGVAYCRDTVAPVIDHRPVERVARGAAAPISAVVTDPAGVVSVVVFFRAIGEATFAMVPLGFADESRWSGDIPGEATLGEGVEYYIEATDTVSASARDPSAAPDGALHVIEVYEEPAAEEVTAAETVEAAEPAPEVDTVEAAEPAPEADMAGAEEAGPRDDADSGSAAGGDLETSARHGADGCVGGGDVGALALLGALLATPGRKRRTAQRMGPGSAIAGRSRI